MPNDPLVTKHNQVGGQTNYTNNSFGNLGNLSTGFNVRNYSNMHGYGGAGTGSFDFSSMNELTGSGGGGGYDDSLELDSGIPLTKRNPMLRKNVTGYHSGGRVSPYKYSNGGWAPYGTTNGEGPYVGHKPGSSAYKEYVRQGVIPTGETTFDSNTGRYSRKVKERYAQGGITPQQEANDGAMWANMAARLGQKNADIALLQTQKIIQGNGKGNPYQMPEQRGMMPNAQFDNGGQVDWKNPNINMDNLVSDAYQEMFPDGLSFGPSDGPRNPYTDQMSRTLRDPSAPLEHNISFAPRNRTNEMANQMSESMGLDKLDLNKQKRPTANQGMKMEMSNKEKLSNLLKAIPNEEAYNKLSEKEKAAFDRTWVKYGGVSKKKKKFTSGGRF